MKKKLLESRENRRIILGLAQLAVSSYSLSLTMKQKAADTAAGYLKELNKREIKPAVALQAPAENKKENDMKHLFAAVAAVAAAGAVVGAAGYLAHKYATKKKDEYEDLMYTEEMGEDFIIYEDEEGFEEVDKFAEVAADVKDTVTSAAENVKETVTGAFNDVKEAIEGAMEK